MKLHFAALLVACLLVAAPARADGEVDEKDVLVLTDKSFNETLAKHKYALVEFYAPWCGHCKTLKAPYAEAATILKAHDETIALAKVDATEEKDTAARFDIKGFPTLKWFIDGEEAMDYSGGRTAPEIVSWIKKKTGPPSTILEDTAALDKAKEDATAVFGYFDKFEGDEHEAFEALAAKNDEASFYKTSDAAIAKQLGIAKAPGFAIGRNYPDFGFEAIPGDKHAAMAGKDPLDERLNAFLAAEKLPAFINFSPATSSKIFGAGIDHQVIVIAPADSFAEKAALRKDLIAASDKTRGKIVWVIAHSTADTAEPIINYFGLDKELKTPQVVGFMSSKGKKYAMGENDKVNAKSLEAFAKAVIDGTAPKRTKSAAVPEEPLDEGVTVVVGSTFDSIVKDPKKDVLLEVYAPWCGHCKSLAPIYVKLAKRFRDIDSVVIAKMDGTENEVPELEIQGYPTLLFFPAEKNAEAIKYDEGARELKDLTKFIKKHAKVSYELPKKEDQEKEVEAEEAVAEETDAIDEDGDAEEGHDEL
ncbi:hypothetical protein Ndes2526B_g07391 [Nannochloris sp. 'desiccata']|nr:hypothetical protein KSW81_004602 [Chlorella desiccata (nom. nud.)]KAH7618449.1 putative Protein disulfide isomerase-like 1-4 [Chlorella desiccata (nom. nud.)]